MVLQNAVKGTPVDPVKDPRKKKKTYGSHQGTGLIGLRVSGVLGVSCLRGSWGFELVESGVESDKALNGLFQRK